MPTRTTRSQVTFAKSFALPELDHPLPAGIYEIDTDEEVVEGNEHTTYVRVATLLRVHGLGSTRTVTIDPDSLAAAVRLDAAEN